jgi:hypothetical protein
MLGRREFLRVGGLTVVTTAIVAACTGDDDDDPAATPGTDGGRASSPSDADIDVLQAASAIELGALEAYDAVLESGVLTTDAVVERAELFRTHHEEHARLLQSVIEDAGAGPVTVADTSRFDVLLGAIADEQSGVRVLFDAEGILEAAYQGSVGGYDDASLNQVAMTVGGVEARHGAVFAPTLGEQPSPTAFQ